MITLFWSKCLTYQDAKNYTKVIYLHEWSGKAFYWGKADNSFFGGTPRKRKTDGKKCSGRYNSGYKHWIEGCLKHGASLYVAEILENIEEYTLDEIEGYLIVNYGSEMNNRKNSKKNLVIQHEGEVPETIKNNNSFPI